MGKRGIPDRWLDYTAIGEKIEGVPIRACKVPLKQAIVQWSLKREEWFTPQMLMDRVPDLGCVVDLTATRRYYDPTEFTRRGIRHVKIFCEGHVIPDAETVERFYEAVNEFLGHSVSNDKVLLVHCTHGLNRTGYLVARYLVEQRGFEPQAAIRAFNAARGHNIERGNYLADLQDRKATSVPIAPTPASVFELKVHERCEQTSRDRDRRGGYAYGRSWSRDSRTSSRQEPRESNRSERCRSYDDRDRNSERKEHQSADSRSHRDEEHRQRHTWRPDRAMHSATVAPVTPDNQAEPEPPGASDGASLDVKPVVDSTKPPKWKIPKKISQ